MISLYTHSLHCRLSCPYGEVQIKDLYKKEKEPETQSVNVVEVIEDSKDMNNLRSKNEPEIVLTDSPIKPEPFKSGPAQIPMETESVTVMASSDPSEVGTANLRTLLAKSDNKSPYSDISDGSDTDIHQPKPGKQTNKIPSEAHPSLPVINGFNSYKNKPNSKGTETLSNLSARLPSFGDVGRPKGTKKEAKNSSQNDEHIPDSQPSSPRNGGKQSNSVVDVRSKLFSAYPDPTNTIAIPVSNPEQNQRHSQVDVPSVYGNSVTKPTKGHDESHHSDLHTLSTVAAALLPNNEKPPKHPKMTMLTQEDFNKSDSRVKRSVSPRPVSLVPKSTAARRSQSPALFSKQSLEQQAATLPSFDSAPGKRTSDGALIHSPPVIVKPGSNICEWGGIESSRAEDDHDSDSSGSGSILHVKPSVQQKFVSKGGDGIKFEGATRDEAGVSKCVFTVHVCVCVCMYVCMCV